MDSNRAVANKPATKRALLLGPGVCRTMPVGNTTCVSYHFETYLLRMVSLQKGRPAQEVYLHVDWLYCSDEELQLALMGAI